MEELIKNIPSEEAEFITINSERAKYFYDKANTTKIKKIIKPALESIKELKKSGTDTFILKGGINSWTADGLPLLD